MTKQRDELEVLREQATMPFTGSPGEYAEHKARRRAACDELLRRAGSSDSDALEVLVDLVAAAAAPVGEVALIPPTPGALERLQAHATNPLRSLTTSALFVAWHVTMTEEEAARAALHVLRLRIGVSAKAAELLRSLGPAALARVLTKEPVLSALAALFPAEADADIAGSETDVAETPTDIAEAAGVAELITESVALAANDLRDALGQLRLCSLAATVIAWASHRSPGSFRKAIPDLLQIVAVATSSHDTRDVALPAARALLALGAEGPLFDAIERRITHGDAAARVFIAKLLGRIGGERARLRLEALLGHPDANTRAAGAKALAWIGTVSPAALERIVGLLGDRAPANVDQLVPSIGPRRSEEVRDAAAEALGRIGGPDAAAALMSHAWLDDPPHDIDEAIARVARDALPLLLAVTDTPDQDRRATAAWLLRRIVDAFPDGGPEAIAIRQALNHLERDEMR